MCNKSCAFPSCYCLPLLSVWGGEQAWSTNWDVEEPEKGTQENVKEEKIKSVYSLWMRVLAKNNESGHPCNGASTTSSVRLRLILKLLCLACKCEYSCCWWACKQSHCLLVCNKCLWNTNGKDECVLLLVLCSIQNLKQLLCSLHWKSQMQPFGWVILYFNWLLSCSAIYSRTVIIAAARQRRLLLSGRGIRDWFPLHLIFDK